MSNWHCTLCTVRGHRGWMQTSQLPLYKHCDVNNWMWKGTLTRWMVNVQHQLGCSTTLSGQGCRTTDNMKDTNRQSAPIFTLPAGLSIFRMTVLLSHYNCIYCLSKSLIHAVLNDNESKLFQNVKGEQSGIALTRSYSHTVQIWIQTAGMKRRWRLFRFTIIQPRTG